MNPRNLLGLTMLLVAAVGDVSAATQQGLPMLETVPNWVIYVGLAVVCPEDLNRAIRNRIGGTRNEP